MRKLLTILSLPLLVAACSSVGASPSAAAPTSQPTASAASAFPTDSAEPTASAEDATIRLADSDLGQIVVDAAGRTLYVFTRDTDGTSTCYDQCEANWPPLLAGGELSAGEGLDDSDLATVDRTDGSEQVTYFGKPLYYFAADAAPGDTNGQGVGGVWYVVDAEGELIQ